VIEHSQEAGQAASNECVFMNVWVSECSCEAGRAAFNDCVSMTVSVCVSVFVVPGKLHQTSVCVYVCVCVCS